MFTGDIPFSGCLNPAVIVSILQRKRPERPTHPMFTEELWSLMQRCWDHGHNSRPTAPAVVGILEGVLIRRRPGDHDAVIGADKESSSTARDPGMFPNLAVNTRLTLRRKGSGSQLSLDVQDPTEEADHRANLESGDRETESVRAISTMSGRNGGEDANTGTYYCLPSMEVQVFTLFRFESTTRGASHRDIPANPYIGLSNEDRELGRNISRY